MYVVVSNTSDYSDIQFYPNLKEAVKEFNISEGTVNLIGINDLANFGVTISGEDNATVRGGEILQFRNEEDESETHLCQECGKQMLEDDDEEKWWCEECNFVENYDEESEDDEDDERCCDYKKNGGIHASYCMTRWDDEEEGRD